MCVKDIPNKEKARSWTMTTKTMQARQTDGKCEQRAIDILMLFWRERRFSPRRVDGAIEHDSADTRIDRRRELPGLHPLQECDSLLAVSVTKFRSNHGLPG